MNNVRVLKKAPSLSFCHVISCHVISRVMSCHFIFNIKYLYIHNIHIFIYSYHIVQRSQLRAMLNDHLRWGRLPDPKGRRSTWLVGSPREGIGPVPLVLFKVFSCFLKGFLRFSWFFHRILPLPPPKKKKKKMKKILYKLS